MYGVRCSRFNCVANTFILVGASLSEPLLVTSTAALSIYYGTGACSMIALHMYMYMYMYIHVHVYFLLYVLYMCTAEYWQEAT